ncbi:MAG: hypothetical protein Q9222_007691 [Ikaeria aurantiellina]
MELWNGCIDFDDDGQRRVEDLHFSHPYASSPSFLQRASLKFLGLVETADVPLYLAAGPSLDVWTGSEATKHWLQANLYDNAHDEDASSRALQAGIGQQSRHGVLLSVLDGRCGDKDVAVQKSRQKITEVLLYASTTPHPSSADMIPLPTPPGSSSPTIKDRPERIPETSFRVYALPLSSKIYSALEQASPFQQSGINITDEAFYYISPAPDPAALKDNSHAPKRPKIETLFEDATQNRRLQKKRGGEGVAKTMAGIDSQISIPPLPSPGLASGPQQPKRGILSRASTTGSIIPLHQQPHHPLQPPPKPRRPSLSTKPQRQSSLHRVESALSPSRDTRSPETKVEDENDIAERNKTALSRVIMAGMRMYGFQQQQQRKRSVGTGVDVESQSSLANSIAEPGKAEQEEYKAIYHQTYKASSFVFRKYWTRKLLGQEVLRDTVDAILARFCEDPFVSEDVYLHQQ